ncbi:MAG TPA: 4-hydroxy-tetrahydrodipicolinate reductase, partial [Spirochaetota bacterium]|nr:4-hydroxy-tetrahydrodipicolinate reductase [Spirochaetota bacterium]
MRIAICGIAGRMGKAILTVVLEKGHTLSQALDAEQCPLLGQDAGSLISKKLDVSIESLRSAKLTADAVIDFSSPAATEVLLQKAVEYKIPLVIGTTGFSDAQKQKIEQAAQTIPIVFSPNMSVGVNL